MYYDFDDEDFEFENITKLYQMRHACNIWGEDIVASRLRTTLRKVVTLYYSSIHGSHDLRELLTCPRKVLDELLQRSFKEEQERQERIEQMQAKREQLIQQLKTQRTTFAGIGTNKAKRRLNKLAIHSPLAQAIRLALEIEDKNISAKNSYGEYQQKIYKQKQQLIVKLCQLFQEHNWTYGIQKSEIPLVTHVIFFEIPSCEQISWHFTPEDPIKLPSYQGKWDKKENSTLLKLEAAAVKLLTP
jgi:hypothetical protein